MANEKFIALNFERITDATLSEIRGGKSPNIGPFGTPDPINEKRNYNAVQTISGFLNGLFG